jgi:pyruvyltransferase
MNSLFKAIISFFLPPALYWSTSKNGLENYGDILGPYLFEKLTLKKPILAKSPHDRRYRYFIKNYITVGSVVSVASVNSVVWGSGIIKKNDRVRKASFKAVRGPLTRQRILELGFSCPETYGDPAILLPLFYAPRIVKKYKLGIVPHYVDYDAVFAQYNSVEGVTIIKLHSNNIEKTTDEILACEQILSSSLHGLIVPQAYGIKATWAKFSDKLTGDDVKFYDYFASVGIVSTQFVDLQKSTLTTLPLLSGQIIDKNQLKKIQEELLYSCPFISKSRKKELVALL